MIVSFCSISISLFNDHAKLRFDDWICQYQTSVRSYLLSIINTGLADSMGLV